MNEKYKNMKRKSRVVGIIVCMLIYNIGFSQEKSSTSFDLGADFASRYIWRGLEFSDSPAIQPFAELTSGNFTLGVWASYETGGQVVGQELDFYASYTIGSFSVGITDYSFPVDLVSDEYFMMKSHIGEAVLSFNGTESLPVSLMFNVNIYNDDANSIYTELGFPFKIGGTEVGATIGGGNEMYTTDSEFKIMNVGFSATKDLNITDTFSISATASAIFNPDTDDAYLVFLLSI